MPVLRGYLQSIAVWRNETVESDPAMYPHMHYPNYSEPNLSDTKNLERKKESIIHLSIHTE